MDESTVAAVVRAFCHGFLHLIEQARALPTPPGGVGRGEAEARYRNTQAAILEVLKLDDHRLVALIDLGTKIGKPAFPV